MMNYSREFLLSFSNKDIPSRQVRRRIFHLELKKTEAFRKTELQGIEGNGKPPLKTRTNSMMLSQVKKIGYLCKTCIKRS